MAKNNTRVEAMEQQLGAMEDQLKSMEQHVASLFGGQQSLRTELTTEFEEKIAEATRKSESRFDEMAKRFDELGRLMAGMRGKDSAVNGGSPSNTNVAAARGRPEANIPYTIPMHRQGGKSYNFGGNSTSVQKVPKLDFPRFNGDNPRGWIRKCQKYFSINRMVDQERIVWASMHMEGKADHWFADYLEGRDSVDWHIFETYFINSFISGLKDEIKSMVRLLKPQTLKEAMSKAKLREKAID
ncbi:PREDICTED: uncharacterized protein LOC105963142 [Erythranthe guttata]|uniref:uncharacterized protein LOC105963142 n=1 Tax=Erythranthe guttata TaxID=4155 RepID=UPI00064D8ADD|nr:PREDICTED: uncharacterized protein LOC105963142 [Erythranthe guttata]|eukprot:XP_012842971.1 PREDICTED: uncharacterized protein LOC105963142 [Erythranthe guttata]